MVPERSNEKTVQYGTPVYEDSTGRTNEWVFCSRESRVVKERNERTPQVEHCACRTQYCTVLYLARACPRLGNDYEEKAGRMTTAIFVSIATRGVFACDAMRCDAMIHGRHALPLFPSLAVTASNPSTLTCDNPMPCLDPVISTS